MEKDIHEIQDQLVNDDDAYYFRQIDADNLKREFELATYRASKKWWYKGETYSTSWMIAGIGKKL